MSDEPEVTDGTLITASGLAPVEFVYQVFGKLDVMNPATGILLCPHAVPARALIRMD